MLNFKNIVRQEPLFCRGVNCLVGDNGAGKTNVVDAIYYLSMCKSSLPMTDAQSILHGSDFFLLEGQYLSEEGKNECVVCTFSRKGGKVLKRNGKEYERLADHVGLVPAVIVSPADSALISDAADERRRYLNACISQLDRPYLTTVMRYNAVLAERNRLLKTRPDETMLSIYDRQLVEHGGKIHAARQAFVERLQPIVAEFYGMLSGDREQVEVHYKSELNERSFEEVLLAARQKDLVNEFTTAGIHRDDLVLKIGGFPLRKYGSQGQQKSFLIALKLAQYAIVAEACGEKPILLLDDLFRQARRRACRAAHPAGGRRRLRADIHHRLQFAAAQVDSRQGRRRVRPFHGGGRRDPPGQRCGGRQRCGEDRRGKERRSMRRTKTMLMGDLLEEFFKRPTLPPRWPRAGCRRRGAPSWAIGSPI